MKRPAALPADLPYRGVIGLAKTGFRALGQRLRIEGSEHVPATGPVLIASNHISYVDFVYAGLAAQPRLVRFMAKQEIFAHPVGGPVMRSMRHIPVDRAQGDGSVRSALRYLAAGEAVGIFPEATISRAFDLKEFKSGTVRIAAAAGVPVLPVIVWGTQRMMTKDRPRDFSRGLAISMVVGEPLHPDGSDPDAEAGELKSRMTALLDHAIATYADGTPEGAWWLPARFGGGAPDLDEAVRLDAEERDRRLAKRREERARKR